MVLFSLTLVRHGETASNADLLIQGQLDVPLNDEGREQAALLARALSNSSFTHVFSSDLCRASDTARLILASLDSPPNLVCDSRLRERCFGSFQGCPSESFRATARRHNLDPAGFVPEGAESWQDVRDRVRNFFKSLCESLQSSNPPRPSSKLSRNPSVLNSWPEELGSLGASEIHQSVDSGICADAAPLTVDVEAASGLRPSSSGSSANLSPPVFPSPQPCVRKFSVQSAASDDSYFPDLDARVLLVSHGGAIREFLKLFYFDLNCDLPGGKCSVFKRCPNTGLSTFMVSVDADEVLSVTCLELHSKDHLLGTQFTTANVVYSDPQ